MLDYWYDLLDQEHEEKTENLPRNHLEELLWAKIQHRTQAEKATDNQTINLKWWQHDK
ncbi:hypothetical protein [Larkinella rosea]|uniref:hypothetical protein n=1 Tax=Larkinella rosea TaxID=2025312 RepID=UPI00163A14FE|nr:hypothetical protein [Larkinella rosea]